MSRVRTLSVFIALIALTLAVAACGGSDSGDDNPKSVVEEATFQGIESGNLYLTVEVDVEGKESGNLDVGVKGPFRSDEEADRPELDLSFHANGTLGGKKIDNEGGFTLLGNEAYVGYEGTEYEVDSTTFAFVKSLLEEQSGGQGQASGMAACQEAASDFELDDFVENLKEEGTTDVVGPPTTKVSGDLKVGGALDAINGLIDDPACRKQLKAAGTLPSVAELEDAKGTVAKSLQTAHVELYVGEDNIIRRVVAEAVIEPPKSSKDSAKRVILHLDLAFNNVNEEEQPITISAPSQGKPLSQLFLKLGINPIELLEAFQGGGTPDIGGLLEKLGGAGGGSGGGSGGSSGGQSYYECLGEAKTPVDIQGCTGLLQ